MKAKKREPLRFIRDAYRAGCALRERRYRMLLTRPATPFARVCQAEVRPRPTTRCSPRHPTHFDPSFLESRSLL